MLVYRYWCLGTADLIQYDEDAERPVSKQSLNYLMGVVEVKDINSYDIYCKVENASNFNNRVKVPALALVRIKENYVQLLKMTKRPEDCVGINLCNTWAFIIVCVHSPHTLKLCCSDVHTFINKLNALYAECEVKVNVNQNINKSKIKSVIDFIKPEYISVTLNKYISRTNYVSAQLIKVCNNMMYLLLCLDLAIYFNKHQRPKKISAMLFVYHRSIFQ